MSEKRFVLCKKGDVEYIEDNGCIQLYGFDVLCEMLNELAEENEQLKISLNEYGVDFSAFETFKESIGYNEIEELK